MTTLTNEALKTYFLKEMEYLREESVRFASEYPQVAQELALNAERSDDPHVELLLQSFAYLAGQVRYQMALDDAELPNQLLAAINPHLAMPWPSRSILQLEVQPDGASFDKVNQLAAHSIFTAPLIWNDEPVPCRFRTVKALEIWPIQVLNASVQSHSHFDIPEVASGIKVSLKVMGHYSFQAMPIQRLTFYLDGAQRMAMHDLLYTQLHAIALQDPKNPDNYQLLSPQSCQFHEDLNLNSILPGLSTVHPGLVHLREYFAFPEHFLFFDLTPLDLSRFSQAVDILFLVKRPCPTVDPDGFRLNAVPIVNLFKQALEPFNVSPHKLEYLLSADQFKHSVTEILSLDQVQLQGKDGRIREVPPLYGSTSDMSQGYWQERRETSQNLSVPGTEFYIRFIGSQLKKTGMETAKVTGRAWCCNRRLTEKLGIHSKLNLEGAGPIQRGYLLRKPSRHCTPDLSGDRSRQLVMQLCSHFQPFENTQVGLKMVRDLLLQQASNENPEAQVQINAITALHTRRVTRRLGDDQWRGFCHGIQWQLTLDTDRFGTVSPLVFARALNEALQHRVPMNSFLELELLDERTGESIWRWLPKPGALWNL